MQEMKADVGSISGLGRSVGRGHGIPLQLSCMENPMDGRAWWATVYRLQSEATEHTHMHLQVI